MRLNGYPVYVSPYLCERRFLGWRKTHRRSRINKKWRKKYGAIYAPCPGHCYRMYGVLLACPCVANQLQRLDVAKMRQLS